MGVLGSLHTRSFEDLIISFGEVPTFWEQRVGPCPVAHDDAFTGFTPQTTCPVCGGTGTAYQSVTVPGSGQGQGKIAAPILTAGRARERGLELQAGDLEAIYFESDYAFAEGDRLALPSRRADFAELKVRGSGSGDTLRFAPALAILAVFTSAGVLTPTAYAPSSDGKQITFSGGSAPTAGAQYTVRYRWRPSYVFVEGSFERFPQATNGDYFPTFAQLRLFQQSPIDRKAGDS